MDLSQLEYFRALAHIRHFTKAAASISISQSALSRSITKLENELGHPLFDRTGHVKSPSLRMGSVSSST